MRKWTAIFAALLSWSFTVHGADYPSKPIRVIVTFGAGTGSDVAIRIVTTQLQADTGASIVVENVPGANGLIAINRALAAPADGYTLVQTGTTTHSIGSALYKEAHYDPIKDFTHIAVVAVYPTAAVTNANSQFKTLADLLKVARANPGKVTWGYSSASSQIKGAALQASTNINVTGVPYKTSTEALNDILGGRIDYMVIDVPTALRLARAGQVRPLVILGGQRSQSLPDVPTIGETGNPKLLLDAWLGLGAVAKIPPEAKSWLVTNINRALSNPGVREKLFAVGSESIPSNVQIDQWVETQLVAWRQGVKDAGLQPQ